MSRPSRVLIMPCNNGVLKGSYYLGGGGNNGWATARKYVPEDEVFFAAVDCIPITVASKAHEAALGCIVYEDEMHRTKMAYDYGPPTYSIKNLKQLDLLTDRVKFGLARPEYQFERYVAVVSVFWYRVALIRAIQDLDMWDRTTVFDVAMMGFSRMLLMNAARLFDFPTGVVSGFWSHLNYTEGVRRDRTREYTTLDHSWYKKMPNRYKYGQWAPMVTAPELEDTIIKLNADKPRVEWHTFKDDLPPDPEMRDLREIRERYR